MHLQQSFCPEGKIVPGAALGVMELGAGVYGYRSRFQPAIPAHQGPQKT